MSYASLAILSFNRPQFVQQAIRTARERAGYPLEIIVHDDGSDNRTQDLLHGMLQASEISKLIMNPPGQNQGVGEAVRVSFAAATGDYLIKADQDLIFEQGWLEWTVRLLDRAPIVGMTGVFHYHHEPAPTQRMLIAQHDGWQEHTDFISSAFAIRASDWREGRDPTDGPWAQRWTTHSEAFAEDVLFKQWLQRRGYKLALPDRDLATNRGFGVGPSTVALGIGPGQVQGIQERPLVHADVADVSDVAAPAEVVAPEPEAPSVSGEDFKVGVVFTACAGREDNLRAAVQHLDAQTLPPSYAVVVWDGCGHHEMPACRFPIRHVVIGKHQPGMEQPRNIGVRHLQEACPEAEFVWFLDSDILVGPDCLEQYYHAHKACEAVGEEPHIILGPYEFLPPGMKGIHPEIHEDHRWISFRQYGVEHVLRHELGSGLACFGGNMVWPIERFRDVGGFHPNLHHGRCEDGELGLRAASLGIGISFAANARGYHQWHPVDVAAARAKNERDVPLLNALHPWVQERGLVVTQQDGARFDFVCPACKEQVNSLLYWAHMNSHLT